MRRRREPSLHDCEVHGLDAGSELIIVEGESALGAAEIVRDPQWQAILAMQGKPMNTRKASRVKVSENVQFRALIEAIGSGFGELHVPERRRYERIVLMLDPDADGIHSRALLLLFFHRWLPALLNDGVIYSALPPLWEITSERLEAPLHAWTAKQRKRLTDDLQAQGVKQPTVTRYRGLASMPADKLHRLCFDPAERTLTRLTPQHAESAIAAFEGLKAPR